MLFQISIMDAGNRDLSHLRDVNLPGPVDNYPQIGLYLSPNSDLQFVARSNDVVTRNLHPVDRRKCAGSLHEQRLTEQRQWPTYRIGHHLFKFRIRLDWALRPPDLRRVERWSAGSVLICAEPSRVHQGWRAHARGRSIVH